MNKVQNLIILALTAALSMTAAGIAAQNNTNSPYTRYGYGQLQDQGFSVSQSMGGISYGLRSNATINPGNPASVLPRPATFRVFAPAAAGVVLLLGSCAEPADTPPREIPLDRAYDGNVFEVRVPDVRPGDPYEYRIYRRDGSYQDHCDPFGFGMDLRPGHRSICSPALPSDILNMSTISDTSAVLWII